MAKNSVPTRTSFIFSSKIQLNRTWLSELAKRTIDIIFSLLALIVLAPFMGVIALGIKLDSPGPVLYQGPRIGIYGKKFFILKFRSMYERIESYLGPKVTAEDDQRITQFGHWLRKYKLNELPQFWNVLRGEMSLVGPRPEDPTFVRTWSVEVREEVLSVRPGITSPASVLYHKEESLLKSDNVRQTYIKDIMPSKLRLDQLYIHNHSFWLDLDILYWTILVLLLRKDTFSPSEDLLFWGPISRFIRRYLSWFTLDIMITFIAFGVVGLSWRSFEPLNIGMLNYVGLALLFSLLFSITGAVMGANRIAWSEARTHDSIRLIPAVVIAAAFAIVINSIGDTLPISLILLASALAFGGFISARYRRRLLAGFKSSFHLSRTTSEATQERVLIVSRGNTWQYAVLLFEQRRPTGPFKVVGLVEDDMYKQGMRIHGVDVVGKWEDIPKLVKEHDVGVIISAVDDITPRECRKIQNLCSNTQARLVMIPDFWLAMNSLLSPDDSSSQGNQEMVNVFLEDDPAIVVMEGDLSQKRLN